MIKYDHLAQLGTIQYGIIYVV